MQDLPIILSIAIPIYTGLGYLAFKKRVKFVKMMPVFIILFFFWIFLTIAWNTSAMLLEGKLSDFDNREASKATLDNHSLSFVYSYFLPFVTLGYLWILEYVSSPEPPITKN